MNREQADKLLKTAKQFEALLLLYVGAGQLQVRADLNPEVRAEPEMSGLFLRLP